MAVASLTERGGCLFAQRACVSERGARQQRQRQLAAFGESADDLGGLAGVREFCAGARILQPRARARDGVAKLGRTQQARFHDWGGSGRQESCATCCRRRITAIIRD